MSSVLVPVMWLNLVTLLSKCCQPECGSGVLPENRKVVRNGMNKSYNINKKTTKARKWGDTRISNLKLCLQ